MNIIKNWLLAICAILLMNGCAPLRMPVIVRNAPVEMYKYAYISPTKELTSSTGGTYGGQYGIYGSSTTKSVNPSDVIAGILIKEGYVILPELKPELANETLIVNYGESGRRNRGLGYTIEVTIQFNSAKTNEMICSCTAEGQGETEADDNHQGDDGAAPHLPGGRFSGFTGWGVAGSCHRASFSFHVPGAGPSGPGPYSMVS